MKKLFKILVPFDFSDTAMNALNYAKQFVKLDGNSEIILLHVVEENSDHAEDRLEAVKANVEKQSLSKVKALVVNGELQSTILKVEEDEKADIIFMGTSLVNHEKLNTNTSTFVLLADCPVIVIPIDYDNFQIKKIALVIGEDLIHNSKLLDTLLEVARRFDAKVDVLTVKNKDGEYGYTNEDEKNENTISYYLENFYSQHVFIDGPDIPEGIFKYAKEKEIDLISILPRNHAEGPITSEGALTKALSQVSKIPLLVID
ncbi:universal stress protein [Formosa haliotis]|uniref:universal stress protein n=1 Tax=Formosa haliotis TaxID=1555194 RepID=UPI000826BAD5|nr:universal stress protein [Formosa haliotis]